VFFSTARRRKPLLGEGKETRPVGKEVVATTGVGVAALVQQLQVARVDGHGLVVGNLDEITVRDVVGPGGAAVLLAREGVGLGGSVGGPGTAEAGGGERAEEATAAALGLDNHEVLLVGSSLDGVDLHGLEEVLGSVAHDDGRGGAEAARELADGHASAVDLAVVASKEQVHVLAVTDDSLVDGASAGAGNLSREERLGNAPAVDIAGVRGGPVGEGGGSPLVRKNPDVLGREEEERRGNGVEVLAVLRSSAQLGQAADGAEVHGTVLGTVVMVGGVDEVLAVVKLGGEVLERGPSGLGLGEGLG